LIDIGAHFILSFQPIVEASALTGRAALTKVKVEPKYMLKRAILARRAVITVHDFPAVEIVIAGPEVTPPTSRIWIVTRHMNDHCRAAFSWAH
jgi:hypothetical protein